MYFSSSFKKGYTLMEVLIVVAILGILSAIIVSPFQAFRNSKALDASSEELLSVFSEARGDTLSARDGYQYGVHLESSKIVKYRGPIYSEGDINNKSVTLDTAIEISSISLAGSATSVLFDFLSGETAQAGTVTLRVKNDTSKTRTITILGTGIVTGS